MEELVKTLLIFVLLELYLHMHTHTSIQKRYVHSCTYKQYLRI